MKLGDKQQVLIGVIALGRKDFLYLFLWQLSRMSLRSSSAACPVVAGEDERG